MRRALISLLARVLRPVVAEAVRLEIERRDAGLPPVDTRNTAVALMRELNAIEARRGSR